MAALAPAPTSHHAAYEAGVLLHNRYRKLSNIQMGSYGHVSLARDVFTNAHVAIKAMDKSVRGVSAMARHEVSVLKRLAPGDANICQLLDYFETPTHYFLVFEYCANGDLYDYLKSQGVPSNKGFTNGSPMLFKNFVKELASSVKFAHDHGVYHRDIKPENILIDGNGSVKLTDWGLATLCNKCFDPCIGTEKYMAPETFFKKSSSPRQMVAYDSVKADYWSVGITLLYTLFGSCPFKLANVSDANFQRFVDSPHFLFVLYPQLSPHGFKAVMQLLQLNPMHRSLDRCLEALMEDYTAGLTLDQEMDQFVDYEPEQQLVFGLDEEEMAAATTQHVDIASSSSMPMSIPAQPMLTSESLPSSLVPSLLDSCPTGTSWADMEDDDWSTSFKIQHIASFQHHK